MARINKILPLSLVIILSACSSPSNGFKKTVFCFDTLTSIVLNKNDKQVVDDLEDILLRYDKITDNYQPRDIFNVYSLNHMEGETVYIGDQPGQAPQELYDIIKAAHEAHYKKGASHFYILVGTLAKMWKEALTKGEVLSQETIDAEVERFNTTNYSFGDIDGLHISKYGDAEIDLGAIAKGAALDACKTYLDTTSITDYIIDAGSSSILLGKKNNDTGNYTIRLKDLPGTYFTAKNCFVSTSGISEQSWTINGVTYSHIVDSKTGSAVCLNDTVIVLTDNGAYGDAMSTSMMNNTVEEIEQLEETYPIKSIVIKDGKIVHKHKDIVLMS